MKIRERADSTLPRVQIAALPWRRVDTLEIMLVSSRDTRRWVLPKGWPMKGRKPHDAAAREALEEAGIIGVINPKPVGDYHYIKRGRNGATLLCKVTVFPLRVERERKYWLEKHERVRRWVSPAEAAELVQEPELRTLLMEFDPSPRQTASAA